MDASNPQSPNLYTDSRADIAEMYGERRGNAADYGNRGGIVGSGAVEQTITVEPIVDATSTTTEPEQLDLFAEPVLTEREKVMLQAKALREKSRANQSDVSLDAGGDSWRKAAGRVRGPGVI